MIYDTLQHVHNYMGLNEGLDKALLFLTETDFSTLADGRYPIDGDNVFASISCPETLVDNPTPEAHKKYIDLQFLISGAEIIKVAQLEEMGKIDRANPDGDIWFYEGSGQPLLLTGDYFILLFPNDAHAPCIAPDGVPAPTRKLVIKIRAW